MKKLALIALLCMALSASHVSWLGDYDRALEKANKESKPLLVLLIKNDCNSCKSVVKEVFSNKEYIDKINKEYVAVIINYDNQHYPIELFYSTVFPTLFLVDSKSETFLHKPLYNKEIVEKTVAKLF